VSDFPPLPDTIEALGEPVWEAFQPYYEELQQRAVTAATRRRWLADWSKLARAVQETTSMLLIEKSLDTADEAKEQNFLDFINSVQPKLEVANQKLREKLLELNVPDEDMALVLRHFRNEVRLFREANIPLLTELQRLDNDYDKVTGAMKVNWNGEEKNLSQLGQLLRNKDRTLRERAWRTIMELWLADRSRLNDIYTAMLALRQQVAANADLPDYRAYAFLEKGRFDYTPEDCFTFHQAIETAVLPAARRIIEKKRVELGVERLRPWDLDVETGGAPPLQPYETAAELIQRSLAIFNQVDPELGGHFATMAEEQLLDLDTRPGKALGGYCRSLPLRRRPFIFMNGLGIHDDVQTLLHEAGHAFHEFAVAHLPFIWQTDAPMEFCEVASMAMELLAAPYLPRENGGFYSEAEAARARIEHLEGILLFLPYMAVVDAFQHWVYLHPEQAADAANCDATWDGLWRRFMPDVVDWQGLEDVRMTGWHRKPHIFGSPFYYIEYGLAQVGALQVWRNSLQDHAAALAAYRRALAAGGTQTLPELFAIAGAEFRFDTAMLTELVALVEKTLAELEARGR
jgi:oligoendopeptidase F